MLKSTWCLLHVLVLFGGVYSGAVKWGKFDFIGAENRLVYTCTSTGKVGDILSWYQVKGQKTTLLRRIQHTSEEMQLTLNLTLQDTDNSTQIFCVSGMLQDDNRIETEKAPISFQKSIPPLGNASVTVTPKDNPVYFEVNTNRTFVCNGSKPIDGRKLTWYIQGLDSKPTYVETQIWDNAMYISTLTLHLNETYHLKKLFCVQDFHYNYTRDGTFHIESYGQIAKSAIVILHQKGIKENEGEGNMDKEESKLEDSGNSKEEIGNEDIHNETREDNKTGGLQSGPPGSPLVYAIPIVVVALLLVAATAWFLCRRRTTTPEKIEEECTYATPKVSYVTLDLQNSTSEYASSTVQDKTPYAQIIGIYRPEYQQRT